MAANYAFHMPSSADTTKLCKLRKAAESSIVIAMTCAHCLGGLVTKVHVG